MPTSVKPNRACPRAGRGWGRRRRAVAGAGPRARAPHGRPGLVARVCGSSGVRILEELRHGHQDRCGHREVDHHDRDEGPPAPDRPDEDDEADDGEGRRGEDDEQDEAAVRETGRRGGRESPALACWRPARPSRAEVVWPRRGGRTPVVAGLAARRSSGGWSSARRGAMMTAPFCTVVMSKVSDRISCSSTIAAGVWVGVARSAVVTRVVRR